MPHREFFQVDVPAHPNRNRALHGVHVFTGEASSGRQALKRARKGYDRARAAHRAGRQIPVGRPGTWAARGLRPGWELDWSAATVDLWMP
ncbi:hypothetical protein [Streptomyces cadmiisoli]|uniref:hypothetical protein n=1 Tax=Streptomyces cadmiisoli TaxID=2184053 RepID=UPI003D71321E